MLRQLKRFFCSIQYCQENLIYFVVWSLIFLAPLLTLYVSKTDASGFIFKWDEVLVVWRMLALYLLLFVVHNFLFAPLLFCKRKNILYFLLVSVIVVSFAVFQYNDRPEKMTRAPLIEREAFPRSGFSHSALDKGHRPPPPPHVKRPNGAPPVVWQRNILSIAVLVFMFGANFGVKAYFRSRGDRRRLAELEKQDLEHQLEYLRYQINPHFFMNTLNNIHALVDIDPEQAKDAIRGFSKMMRFVLYDGNRCSVLLADELDFVRNYVALMRLRYTDKVRINIELPDELPDLLLPPMILITFVENAFKHGVSYQRDSFVDVRVTVEEGRLRFVCHNSKGLTPNTGKSGLGLANVRKRLDLLYGSEYSLVIHDETDKYMVDLIIPLVL